VLATPCLDQAILDSVSALDVDDGGLHKSDHLVDAIRSRERSDFAGANRQELSSIQDPANGHKAFAQGWAQQVDFEFRRDHLEARGRLRQRRIAARTVDNAGGRARMKISMLLGKGGRERKLDVDISIVDPGQPGTDGRHQALRVEAVRDSLVDVAHWHG